MDMNGPYDDVDGFADPAPPLPLPDGGGAVEELPLRPDAQEYTDEQVLEDFGSLDDFVSPEPKRLPYNGVVYDFPADVSARSWLLLQRIRREGQRAALAAKRGEEYDGEAVIMDDADEEFLRRDIMGGAAEELQEDDVPGRVIERMFATLMIWHLSGKEIAVRMWRGEISQGEAAARSQNREQRRAQARQRARESRRAAR